MSITNYLLQQYLSNQDDAQVGLEDIIGSKRVLFALFTRYGDTLICLSIIKEFITRHPNKEYTVVCPKQMSPYVKLVLPDVSVITVNKRNSIKLLWTLWLLKRKRFDIAFNPWSFGVESGVFVSFARRFSCYKNCQPPLGINHYDAVRRYLLLPIKPWSVNELQLKETYSRILICPQSTDTKRSIHGLALDTLIVTLTSRYPNSTITIAAMESSYFRPHIKSFLFAKKAHSSDSFIQLMRSSDLVVCSDSAPQHLADTLQIDRIVFFESTKPSGVINTGSTVMTINCSALLDSHFSLDNSQAAEAVI